MLTSNQRGKISFGNQDARRAVYLNPDIDGQEVYRYPFSYVTVQLR